MNANRQQDHVLIIGCGYVGAALGKALVEAGHEVVGTTTTPERLGELQRLGMKSERVEIHDVDRLHALMAHCRAVYLTIAPRQRGQDYRDVYLTGVRNLVAAAEGTPVTRLIYTSSTRVYGQDDGSWVDESSPTEPRDENGRILLEAERALLDGASRLRSATGGDVYATVGRLSGIYGPGRDVSVRVRGLAGTQRSDGDVYVNLVHRDDIVKSLCHLLDVHHHGVLNLSDDRPTLRREMYDRILAEAGLPPIVWRTEGQTSSRGKRVSNAKIKSLLDLTLRHPTH